MEYSYPIPVLNRDAQGRDAQVWKYINIFDIKDIIRTPCLYGPGPSNFGEVRMKGGARYTVTGSDLSVLSHLVKLRDLFQETSNPGDDHDSNP